MKINTNRSSYTLISRLGILINSEIDDELKSLYPDSQQVDEETLIKRLRADITDEEIESHICSCRNLVLNVTDQCNFRCRYCAYSGIYDNVRTHSQKKMELSTAKKAVDLYIKNLKIKKRKIKINTISVGFYGGESLLEFSFIKDIVKYTKEKVSKNGIDKMFDLQFRVSTNGYLLYKKKIVDYLVRNNIGIDVSLDGPKEEHDKFRVTNNNENSWETIWENLNYLYTNYPEYATKHITYLATLHPLHNYNKIDRFFLDNPDRFDITGLLVNQVSKLFLKEPLLDKWFGKESLQTSQLLQIKNKVRLDKKFTLKRISSDSNFTAMCFPGEVKLFVSTDGKILLCERVKQDIPIGNVEDGFDYDAIRKVQRLWNEEIIRNRCWECPALTLCHFCVSHSEDKDGIHLDCNYKNRLQSVLSNYLSFKEDEMIKDNSSHKYSKYSVKEYFQQL